MTRGAVELVTGRTDDGAVAVAARLLHDFNVEYGEPTPPPRELAERLVELIAGDHVTVLRLQPSLWSRTREAYLAELYVVPDRRGRGHGRELLSECLQVARARGATYALVVTSEQDRSAQRLYEAAGFRRTEGEGGPVMLAYERDL